MPSREHQVARQRLSQSISLHQAWHTPVREQDLLMRQHSTTMQVQAWHPSLRSARAEYTATVNKHAAKAQVAGWTPATAGRASAVQGEQLQDAQGKNSATVLSMHLSELCVPAWAVSSAVLPRLAPDPLVLSLEEAAWLALHCQALDVYPSRTDWCRQVMGLSGVASMSREQLAAAFTVAEPVWHRKVCVYSYLRNQNWVVRSGAAFAGEYVLYPDGPAAGHAVYSLAMRQTPGWACTWRNALGRLRVANTVSKQLLIVKAKGNSAQDVAEGAGTAAGPAADCGTKPITTVLLRGVRLDSEAALKSRRHIRDIVAKWAEDLPASVLPQTHQSAGGACSGRKGGTRVAVFDASAWAGKMEPDAHVSAPDCDVVVGWLQTAADWIGR